MTDKKVIEDKAFELHTADGFACQDPGCMFPADLYSWCTRSAAIAAIRGDR